MIYGHILGGFGNQLFIYSFCERLVNETGQNARMYFDSIDGRSLNINRYKLNNNIDIVNEPFNLMEKVNGSLYRKFVFFRKCMEHSKIRVMQNIVMFIANCFGCIPMLGGHANIYYKILKKKKNIIFYGYFQGEKYFAPVKDSIIERFGKINTADTDNMKDSVCVHIRRGDYLDETHRNIFFVCTELYYEDAVNKMEDLVGDCKFYVFSDDIEWVKNNMIFLSKKDTVFVNNDGDDAVNKDFEIMKSCHHFIISNSTLSWWAQYLGIQPDKKVIAPSRWLNGKYNNPYIFMDNWILLDV